MIRKINLFEYLTDTAALRTALSDYYIKTSGCDILASFNESREAEGLLLYTDGHVFEVLFINTLHDDRDDVIKTELIEELCKASAGNPVRWRMSGSEKERNTGLAIALGFEHESTLRLFKADRSCVKAAEAVMKEQSRLYAFMEKHGYEAKSFSELSDRELSYIKEDPDNEFAAYLHPAELLEMKAGGFSPELSFAALYKGKVCAYTMVRMPDRRHCIFEMICVARSKRKTGVYILPFMKTLSALIDSSADSVNFAVYESNTDSLKVVEKHFKTLIKEENLQHNYYRSTSSLCLSTSPAKNPPSAISSS